MFDKAMPGEEIKEQVISKTALGRLGQPEDIASVVAFLAGKDGGWVTGQAIRADGGINI
jgi:3-oxoacyl-[acyl-carrier protein] reductase